MRSFKLAMHELIQKYYLRLYKGSLDEKTKKKLWNKVEYHQNKINEYHDA